MTDATPNGCLSNEQQRSMRDEFLGVRQKLDAISADHPIFKETLEQSLDVVRRALDEFGGQTGAEGLAISFNGGKDACVVLYLLMLVLAERDQLGLLSKGGGQGISVVYFEKEEFPEVEEFIIHVSERYGFEFLSYALSYKDGMQDLVDSHGTKGVLLGQRRGDPWTESMEWFTPSTPGWAAFIRVNPALEWKFCDIWRFLRGSGLPYCVLYDQGYTSLGERGNTSKNEALRLPNGQYRPAYELAEEEEHLERFPRTPPNRNHKVGQPGRKKDEDEEKRDDVEGGGDGVAGKTGAPPVGPLKRVSEWGKQRNFLDKTKDAVRAPRDDGLSSGSGDVDGAHAVEGEAGETNHGGTTSFESLRVGTIVGVGEVVGEGVSSYVAGHHRNSEVGGEVARLVSGTGTCLQPKVQGRDAPTGWVGASARWLPLTAVLTLALAVVGLRRSGIPEGADVSMEGRKG